MTLATNKAKFLWSDICVNNFQLLKEKITSAPVLALLEGTEGSVIYSDASRVGSGVFLYNMAR